jgi:hypothetical protein
MFKPNPTPAIAIAGSRFEAQDPELAARDGAHH